MVVLLAVLLGLLAPAVAQAEEAPDVLGLDVVTGYGAPQTPARWQPVEVALEPVRPLSGTLEVEAGGVEGTTTYAREVEVAASSRSVYRFVVPLGSVSVRFREQDRDPVTVRPRVEQPGEEFLVGFLGDLPPSPPPVRHEPTGRTGAWVGIDPAWLSVSPAALEPLGSLVAEPAALEALPEEAIRNLAAAVVAGIDLFVVDEEAPELPGPLGALDTGAEAWTLTDPSGAAVAEVRGAGRGRFGVVTVPPGAGDPALWSALAGPPGAHGRGSEWDLTRAPYQFPRLLGSEEGGAPTIPWLASFLVAYIVVVGPVNGLVLARMRRRELAWVTVPVVTAIFTVAAFTGAVGGRPPLGVTARLAYWVDGVGSEAVLVGLRNPTPGVRTATLPGGGWTTQAFGNANGATITAGDGVRAEIDLAALQLGGVVGTRPIEPPPPLEVQAVAGPDEVEVTVRNVSGATVDDVTLRTATTTRRVGALAAGGAETVTLKGDRLRPVDPYRDLLQGMADPRSGSAAPPGSLEALLRGDLLDGSPGLVWALGQAGPSGLPVDAGGEPAEDAGTLLAVAVTPELPGDGRIGPFAVERALVSVGGQGFLPSPLAIEGPDEVVLRHRFPAGGTLDRLHADLERGAGEVAPLAVWDLTARQWVPVADAFGDGGADPARFLSSLGEVHVRSTGRRSIFDFSARSIAGVEVTE